MKLSRHKFEAGPGKSPQQYRQVLIESGVPTPLAEEATRIRFDRHTALNESERQTLLTVFQLLLGRVQ